VKGVKGEIVITVAGDVRRKGKEREEIGTREDEIEEIS
jgi:hypothetical protein